MKIISKYTLIISLLIALVSLESCRDDDLGYNYTETDEITIGVPDMQNIISSRALPTTQENYIYSLYFFIVGNNGNIVGKKYVRLTAPSETYTIKLDNKVATSQYLYAVANAEFTENSFNAAELKDQMDNATAVSQLQEIYASYASGSENFERPQGHLLMSGILKNPSITNNTLTLKHIDARINFNITLTDSAFNKGATFTPLSYQIINIPKKCYLLDRIDPANKPLLVNQTTPYDCPWDAVSCTDANDYFNSSEINYFNKTWDSNKKMTSSFDFYMLENRKTAIKTTGGIYPTNYSKRDMKMNGNGKYLYAHEYSTYVIIKGKYTIGNFVIEDALLPATDGVKVTITGRDADVVYTIHLGDFGNSTQPGNTDNFFTERGCNYTYNIKIKNVLSIAVEAVTNVENQSSAEGDVNDGYQGLNGLDAHFGNVHIKVKLPTDASIYNSPNCMTVTTPYSQGVPDYSWFQFAVNDVQTPDRMKSYSGAKGKLIAGAKIIDFLKMVSGLSNKNQYVASDGYIHFTLFVDEYYPQLNIRNSGYNGFFLSGYSPTDKSISTGMQYMGQSVSSADPNIGWKNYINCGNREISMFIKPYKSNDGLSNYNVSQVLVSQKSIQTFYDVTNATSALGVEHIDETGKIPCEDSGGTASSNNDGRTNTINDLTNNHKAITNNWNTYVNATINSSSSQLISPYVKGNYSSLQRNRDLNADGKISADEIRWYRPAKSQLVSISLASQALISPLINGSLTPTSTGRDGKMLHYHSSTGKWMLWTEEIVSTGEDVVENEYNISSRTIGNADYVPQDYFVYASRVVKFPYFNNQILRTPIISGELIPMTEWDTSNRLPKNGFKIATQDAIGTASMENLDKGLSPCASYSEGTGYNAAGKWRVPNLLELEIMEILKNNGVLTLSTNPIMSCTKFSWAYKQKLNNDAIQLVPLTNSTNGYWYAYNNHHFLYYNGSTNITLSTSNYYTDKKYVRCVRDIQNGE